MIVNCNFFAFVQINICSKTSSVKRGYSFLCLFEALGVAVQGWLGVLILRIPRKLPQELLFGANRKVPNIVTPIRWAGGARVAYKCIQLWLSSVTQNLVQDIHLYVHASIPQALHQTSIG